MTARVTSSRSPTDFGFLFGERSPLANKTFHENGRPADILSRRSAAANSHVREARSSAVNWPRVDVCVAIRSVAANTKVAHRSRAPATASSERLWHDESTMGFLKRLFGGSSEADRGRAARDPGNARRSRCRGARARAGARAWRAGPAQRPAAAPAQVRGVRVGAAAHRAGLAAPTTRTPRRKTPDVLRPG